MWTLSGFADEIDADLKVQCDVLNELGIRFVEFRSAWDVNVLDLSDDQIDEVTRILGASNLLVSCIGSPIGMLALVAPPPRSPGSCRTQASSTRDHSTADRQHRNDPAGE